MALEKWDQALREYTEAGGRAPAFDERRSSMLAILPISFREPILFRVPGMQDAMLGATPEEQDMAYSNLRAQVQRQVELVIQWGSMMGHKIPANILPGGAPQEEGQPAGEWTAEDIEAFAVFKGKLRRKRTHDPPVQEASCTLE